MSTSNAAGGPAALSIFDQIFAAEQPAEAAQREVDGRWEKASRLMGEVGEAFAALDQFGGLQLGYDETLPNGESARAGFVRALLRLGAALRTADLDDRVAAPTEENTPAWTLAVELVRLAAVGDGDRLKAEVDRFIRFEVGQMALCHLKYHLLDSLSPQRGAPDGSRVPPTGGGERPEGETTAPVEPAKTRKPPSDERRQQIIAAIRQKGSPLQTNEVATALKDPRVATLKRELAWMVTNRDLVNIKDEGYWPGTDPLPR